MFDNKEELDINKMTCHSGGAEGSDSIWEFYSILYGMNVNAYSYKTKYHKSESKVEISDEDFEEGVAMIKKANKILKRSGVNKYINLLARNWAQVKYSKEIFAVGEIVDKNNGVVNGGTGWAVAMGIINEKTVYVFDQIKNSWYKWSYILDRFTKLNKQPTIQEEDFAGIGTRKINENGEIAIKEIFEKTFS